MTEPIEHEIRLDLSTGAKLTLLYFSDTEQRWIFEYRYMFGGARTSGMVNDVRLAASYARGVLASRFVLSMHVVVPARLGQVSFLGVDISPGAKTYLEFRYGAGEREYLLEELGRGAHTVRLAELGEALVKPIDFPFPVPDRVPRADRIRVPFLRNDDVIDHFDLPVETRRRP